jgi:RNA polymerase sigma factor (sigma-70 family)
MTAETRDWMTELMADAAWTRRMARALLGDPGSADDALQEVWIKTRGRVPAGLDDGQGWLRRVLLNRLRTDRRAERRRVAREQTSADQGLAAPATVATPEELLGRLEVHRTLAALVAALEEPGRNVLLLHYYEGMTSAQIAAATGTPAGTVRWRLKTALDDLRSSLDSHYAGEKKDWRRALAPLMPLGWKAAHRSSTTASAAVLAILLAGATGLLVTLFERDPRRAASGTLAAEAEAAHGDGPAGRMPPPASRRPGARPLAVAGAALARPCTEEIRVLDGELTRAREALAYHLPPRNVWAEAGESGRNPTAQLAIAPAVDRWLDEKGAPRAGRSIDCRQDACIVKVLQAWPPRPSWVNREPSAAAQAALERHARSIEIQGHTRRTGAPAAEEAESQLWFRLHSPSGAAGPSAPPPFPTTLLPSAALRPARPADETPLTAECRERKGTLEAELEKLRRRSVSLVSAPLLFQTERPNPALTARLQPLLDRFVRAGQTLPEPDRRPPLRIGCRGNVCQVTLAQGSGLPSALIGPLLEDEGFGVHVRRSSARSVNGQVKDGLYVTVLPPPSETTSGEDVLRHFLKQLRSQGGMELCKQKFPASGTLTLRFVLPGTGEVNEDGIPERVSFRLGGPVAETPFGHCLAETFTRLTEAFVPPTGISRAEMSKTTQLPD